MSADTWTHECWRTGGGPWTIAKGEACVECGWREPDVTECRHGGLRRKCETCDIEAELLAARERIAELERVVVLRNAEVQTWMKDVFVAQDALASARAVIEAARPYIPKSKPPKQAAEAYAAWLALAEYDRGES